MSPLDAKAQVQAAYQWWLALQPRANKDGSRYRGDRATLARLRRCATPFDAAFEPATIELFQKLGLERPEKTLPGVAALAVVLAHVREDKKEKFARALGPPRGGKPEDALLKPLRFRRLIAARGTEETLTAFRRAVEMLGGVADVRDLAGLLLVWDQDEIGDRVRVRFAFDYHDAGDFAPADHTSEPQAKDYAP